MKTLNISQEDATSLGKVLNIFNDFRTQIVHEGSLTLDNVTLEWNKDIIRLKFNDPTLNHDLKEE